jgi:hypothetical protein
MQVRGQAARLITARPFFVNIRRPFVPPTGASAPGTLPPIPDSGQWFVRPHWLGETVFIVASGPSIADVDFELIRGRRIICVNSSYERVPFADIVYFGDGRWWEEHKRALAGLSCRVVTCSGLPRGKSLLRVGRMKPENPATGFSERRDVVASQRTSLQGAMNLAAHMIYADGGPVGSIVLVGADMGRSKDGRSHGHTPHKWVNRPGNITWDEQMRHLKWIAAPLRKRGIAVVNASPVSRIPWWPKMSLQEFLTMEKLASKGGWDWRRGIGV